MMFHDESCRISQKTTAPAVSIHHASEALFVSRSAGVTYAGGVATRALLSAPLALTLGSCEVVARRMYACMSAIYTRSGGARREASVADLISIPVGGPAANHVGRKPAPTTTSFPEQSERPSSLRATWLAARSCCPPPKKRG